VVEKSGIAQGEPHENPSFDEELQETVTMKDQLSDIKDGDNKRSRKTTHWGGGGCGGGGGGVGGGGGDIWLTDQELDRGKKIGHRSLSLRRGITTTGALRRTTSVCHRRPDLTLRVKEFEGDRARLTTAGKYAIKEGGHWGVLLSEGSRCTAHTRGGESCHGWVGWIRIIVFLHLGTRKSTTKTPEGTTLGSGRG